MIALVESRIKKGKMFLYWMEFSPMVSQPNSDSTKMDKCKAMDFPIFCEKPMIYEEW